MRIVAQVITRQYASVVDYLRIVIFGAESETLTGGVDISAPAWDQLAVGGINRNTDLFATADGRRSAKPVGKQRQVIWRANVRLV